MLAPIDVRRHCDHDDDDGVDQGGELGVAHELSHANDADEPFRDRAGQPAEARIDWPAVDAGRGVSRVDVTDPHRRERAGDGDGIH